MTDLEQRLGYTFKNPKLLENAIVHSSYANENRAAGFKSNERLEFLGDSVLGFIVAEHLYRKYPDKSEGELTRLRAALVCEASLVQVARELGVGQYLLLGKGEASGGGRERISILADAVEAVIAAVYLDGGAKAAKSLVGKLILDTLSSKSADNMDYKTLLQEYVQREKEQYLSYELTGEQGPNHEKSFCVEVSLNGEVIGEGSGKSKKEAEQAAAKLAMERLHAI